MSGKQIKVAFIQDWLIEKGGSEKLLASMLEIWPSAPIYTLVHHSSGTSGTRYHDQLLM